jgi:hypothetical protein
VCGLLNRTPLRQGGPVGGRPILEDVLRRPSPEQGLLDRQGAMDSTKMHHRPVLPTHV